MQGLALAMMCFLVLEGVCHVIETAQEHGKILWVPGQGLSIMGVTFNGWKAGGFVCQKFVDISLFGPFAYTFIFANNIAACPSYEAGNANFQWFYISFVLLYGFYLIQLFMASSGLDMAYLFVHELRHWGKMAYMSVDTIGGSSVSM
jgi:hypothetical protein